MRSQQPTTHDVGHLLGFLKDRDHPCPVCQYNLRDLTRPVCPECGCDLQLQVGSGTPSFGLMLLALTPLIFFAGWGLVFGIAWVMLRDTPAWQQGVLMVMGLVDLVACFVWYRKRRRFLRYSRARQLTIAVLLWAIHFLLLLVLIGSPMK